MRGLHLAELGERLDALRKDRLAEHELLTMTGCTMCSSVCGRSIMAARCPRSQIGERGIHEAGLISMLKDVHDEIDRETFAAYAGWIWATLWSQAWRHHAIAPQIKCPEGGRGEAAQPPGRPHRGAPG